MMKASSTHFKLYHVLWITAIIARAGSVIAVSSSDQTGWAKTSTELRSSKDISSALTLTKKKHPVGKRLFRNPEGTPMGGSKLVPVQLSTPPSVDVEDDTCNGKSDGYFASYGSDCTSYYFCAAGYQITYVCPPNSKFNVEKRKCEEHAVCTSASGRVAENPCKLKRNGYYSKRHSSAQYYYCFNNAKVIELTCDEGKAFIGDKCTSIFDSDSEQTRNERASCEEKTNGFYPVLDSSNSDCSNYYYCIQGQKTKLRCNDGLIFNGDICVSPERFECTEKDEVTGKLVALTDDSVYEVDREKSHQ